MLQLLIGYSTTRFFKLERLNLSANHKIKINLDSFAGIYVLKGKGVLNNIELKKGEQYFLPVGIEELDFYADSDMEIIIFYGPEI